MKPTVLASANPRFSRNNNSPPYYAPCVPHAPCPPPRPLPLLPPPPLPLAPPLRLPPPPAATICQYRPSPQLLPLTAAALNHPSRVQFSLKKGEDLGNADAVSHHAGSIPVFELPPLPPSDQPLGPWYDANAQRFGSVLGRLAERRAEGVANVASMEARGRKALWWPFTQHDDLAEGKVNLIDSAYGDYLCKATVEKEGGEGEGEGGEVRGERVVETFCFSRVRFVKKGGEGRRGEESGNGGGWQVGDGVLPAVFPLLDML